MPSMQFVPILDLCVTHPYYDDGRSNDFAIEPTARTASRLAGLRLFWKPRGDHLSVFAGLDRQGQPLVSLSSAEAFDFVLRLRNQDFLSFTDLDDFDALPAPLFTAAGAEPGNPSRLRLITRTAWRQAALTVRQSGSGELFLLPDPPLPGTRPEEIGIEPAGVVGAVKTADAANKRITIDTSGAAAGVAFTASYPVAPGRGRDVFAEVQLTIDDTLLRNSLDSGAPRVFQVPFAAPVTKWCYYLVTDRPEAAEAFLIVDATPGGAPRQVVFSDAGRADLSQQPDTSDPVAANLQRHHPGKRILRFVSDGQVACRKRPVKNLELQVGGSRLFASLPNPSPRCRAMLPAAGPEPDQPVTVFFQTITLVTS